MNFRDILEYYSREDILEEMVSYSLHREFVGSMKDGSYLKRPFSIQYPGDIIEMVKNGAVSFHISVERWDNPILIEKGAKRIGWDLLIDIDSKYNLDDAVETVKLILNFIESYGVKSYGIKFSGRRGFHIIIPFEALPKKVNYRPVEELYPDLQRIIVSFIRREIYDKLAEVLMRKGGLKRLMEILGDAPDDIDPFLLVSMNEDEKKEVMEKVMSRVADAEKDWSSRHLFRAPYSINHKSWLVSIPISKSDLDDFDLEMANPSKVKVKEKFIKEAEENEASALVVDALDWWGKKLKEEKKKEKPIRRIERRVPEEMFPPCIKNILAGLEDGRKRSLFTLITFLKKMNWTIPEIEARLIEWNKKNKKPLSQRMILTQIRWHEGKDLMPANCESDMFYQSIGICTPDERCKMIKNPVNYPVFKKEKIHKCKMCGREFKTKRSLKIHISRTHKT